MMVKKRSSFIFLALVLSLAFMIACGTAAPQEQPGQVQPTAAPAAQDTPTAVPQEVAPPPATAPAGELVIATRNLRSGAGTPRFCTAGCAETVYLAGIMETLTGVKAGPGGPLDPQNAPLLAKSWEISPALDAITFQLEEGIQFHGDWGELTAEDVAFTFNGANASITPTASTARPGTSLPLLGRWRLRTGTPSG
jgi:ABC-type transport system substrate-binding protein